MTATTADDQVDRSKRRFLVATTSVVGGAGIVAAAIPFISYMEPSAKAIAAGAPIEADISKIEPGQLITVQWRSRPIWILHRTKDQLKVLPSLNSICKDPDSKEAQQLPSCANVNRSEKPEHFVAVAICTHLGCVPTYRPEIAPADLGPNWKGGFFCPCHGSRYDLAGRVFDGSPAPLNLPVPPYFYKSDTVLRIGETGDGKNQNWHPETW